MDARHFTLVVVLLQEEEEQQREEREKEAERNRKLKYMSELEGGLASQDVPSNTNVGSEICISETEKPSSQTAQATDQERY